MLPTTSRSSIAFDSGWFQVGQLTEYALAHGLGAIPKGVAVLCGPSSGATEVSVVGPSVAHWHDWGGSDYGAFVRMTSTYIYTRTGTYVGRYSNNWQTSGWYKVIAWA